MVKHVRWRRCYTAKTLHSSGPPYCASKFPRFLTPTVGAHPGQEGGERGYCEGAAKTGQDTKHHFSEGMGAHRFGGGGG